MSDEPPVPERAPSQPPRRSISATLVLRVTESGGLNASYVGDAPSNEQDAGFAARNLVGLLNRRGANWSVPIEPAGPEAGVDFESRDGSSVLRLQVTRVPYDQSYWKALRREKVVSRDVDVQRAAADLALAIRAKSQKLAPDIKTRVTLLLDARFSPEHALVDTLNAFDEAHASELQSCGFAEVWVFGVFRTDRLLPGPLDE
jgi:hypothetical protein